jgi:2-polyprenyl-6-methoxyphenol hydroxylase-like FAD-dependent oxidoreductase
MGMTNEQTTCVVAGGGPAGMVLGLLLARAGVEVTVLEKHGDFLRDFRGDTVHPSTLGLLDELGLTEMFQRLPFTRVNRVSLPAADGHNVVIGDFSRLRRKFNYIAMTPQWDLLDMLAAAGRNEPTFTLRMNTEVTGTVVEQGQVVGVRYRTSDGEIGELRADLTVATDGRWSVLRRAAGLRPTEVPVPIDTWWFRIPRVPSDPSLGLNAGVDGDNMALTIDRTDYFQVAYIAAKGRDEQLRAEGIERFRERMARILPQFADRVDAIATMDDVKVLDVRLNLLPRWYVHGLLCIGDAAHAMSPAGGVGINLAVQDAVATARLLAGPLLRHELRTADLAAVQRRRELPTKVIQRLQRIIHAEVFGPIIHGTRAGMPTVLVALLRRVPALTALPAYLIGVGLRTEHAPGFARRPAETADHQAA